GYVGCGYNGVPSSDFWEYDPLTNIWTAKAIFAGGIAHSGTSFAISNKGYAGLGWLQNNILTAGFWEYDPFTNGWTQIADYPGGKRQGAFSFVIGNKGYVGTGNDSTFKVTADFYEYDPSNNLWTQKSNMGGVSRSLAIGFGIGFYGYAGAGYDSANNSLKDFYKYDAVSDSWSPISLYPGMASVDMAAFSIASYGYVGIGQIYPPANTVFNDFWQYNPVLNQWIQKTSFSGLARDEAAFFSIATKGYIGSGGLNGPITNVYYSDFWEFTPDSTTSIEELPASNFQFTISPNPAKDYIVISAEFRAKENIELTITDADGKKVYETQLQTKTLNFKLQTLNFSNGIYFVELTNGKQKAVKKFLKV
ncbi:MAG: T9SS type A sorting domain-containing protein, partial [Bacteroidota bacterium]